MLPVCMSQIGKGRSYTPTAEDVGSNLKCEVVPVDSSLHFNETGALSSASTGRVRPAPSTPARSVIPLPAPRGASPAGKFTALTYNLLADLYASVSHLPCTPYVDTCCVQYSCYDDSCIIC